MATYHLHVSSGSKASGKGAGGKARYLLRDGPYALARERVQEGALVRSVEIDKRAELVHAESGNLPAWAADDPLRFWDASDQYERANGCTYREVEVALPAELSMEQQIALARAFADDVAQVDGGVTPYTLAVHQQDPAHHNHRHVHILLSDRIMDSNDRTPETFFRRYNGKAPERGGARKATARQDTKVGEKWTDRLRPLWEQMANRALEQAGIEARIDHRTLEAQRTGIEQQAANTQLPALARVYREQADALDRPPMPKKGRVLTHGGETKAPERAGMLVDYGQAKAERQAAIAALRAAEREAAEIARKEVILELVQALTQVRRQAARQELDQSHPAPDAKDTQQGITVMQVVTAHLVQRSQAHHQEASERLLRMQAARARRLEREAAEIERQRDAEAAAEQRAGIRSPDKPHWQVYRERVLTEAYNREVGEALARWARVERVEHGIHIHNREMDLTDHGDRITAGKGGTEREIDAMLKLARAKGWERLDLTGSREFQERAGAAALAAGFDLADAALKGRILDAQRQEQESRDKAVAEILRSVNPKDADSLARYIAARRDEAKPVSDESRRLARQDALRKWEGAQDKAWLREKSSAGGWEKLREQYQEQYDQASTGLMSFLPARKKEAARLDGQLKQLDVLLTRRKEAGDAAERALEEKQEAAAQFWARVSPHIDVAQRSFQSQHQAWKDQEAARERQRKLLDFAKALRADSEARMNLAPAYRAAGYQPQEKEGGKKVWAYPNDDLRDERRMVSQARKDWDDRRLARLERERQVAIETERKRQAAEAKAEQERREAEAARAAFLEPRSELAEKQQPNWITGVPGKAPIWQQWREQTLSEKYGDDLAGRVVQEDWYTRMRPDLGGLNVQVRTDTGKMEVVDSGDAIRAEQGRADIPLMLDLARAHGWTTLDITGDENFRKEVASAALQARFDILDKVLEREARQRIEAGRQRQQKPLQKKQPAKGVDHSKDLGDDWGPG